MQINASNVNMCVIKYSQNVLFAFYTYIIAYFVFLFVGGNFRRVDSLVHNLKRLDKLNWLCDYFIQVINRFWIIHDFCINLFFFVTKFAARVYLSYKQLNRFFFYNYQHPITNNINLSFKDYFNNFLIQTSAYFFFFVN